MALVNATPASTNAAPSPIEYVVSRRTPRVIEPALPASTRIEARTAPMQGAAQTANAAPSRMLDPRARARSPVPTARSGQGSRPTNPSPITISRKPANSVCVRLSSTLPNAAAEAPSTTKTTVKPSTKGRLATTTRRAIPGSPSRFASTAEIADR